MNDEVRKAAEAVARKAFAFDAMVAAGRISQELAAESLALADGPIELTDATTIKQAMRDQESEIARLRELLRSEAALLRAWAKESREGGWSTHQVNPMNRRADEITTHLGATQHD